jgi:hypothetical protein
VIPLYHIVGLIVVWSVIAAAGACGLAAAIAAVVAIARSWHGSLEWTALRILARWTGMTRAQRRRVLRRLAWAASRAEWHPPRAFWRTLAHFARRDGDDDPIGSAGMGIDDLRGDA